MLKMWAKGPEDMPSSTENAFIIALLADFYTCPVSHHAPAAERGP